MRPTFVAILLIAIAVILFVLSSRQSENPIARRTRRRTAAIFVVVAVGLTLLDFFGD